MLWNYCYSETAVNEVECKSTTARHVIRSDGCSSICDRVDSSHDQEECFRRRRTHIALSQFKTLLFSTTWSSHAVLLPCDMHMHSSAWVISSSVRRSFTEWNICCPSSYPFLCACPSVPFHLVLTDLIEDVFLALVLHTAGEAESEDCDYKLLLYGNITCNLNAVVCSWGGCCRAFFGLVRRTSTFISS